MADSISLQTLWCELFLAATAGSSPAASHLLTGAGLRTGWLGWDCSHERDGWVELGRLWDLGRTRTGTKLWYPLWQVRVLWAVACREWIVALPQPRAITAPRSQPRSCSPPSYTLWSCSSSLSGLHGDQLGAIQAGLAGKWSPAAGWIHHFAHTWPIDI